MRLKFEFETGGRNRRRADTDDSDRAWERIVAEHLKSATAPPEKFDAARKWVGGAVVVYALMTEQDPAEVLTRLDATHPLPPRPSSVTTAAEPLALPDAMALLQPGRLTPPPPKSPGAQKAVAVDAAAAPAD